MPTLKPWMWGTRLAFRRSPIHVYGGNSDVVQYGRRDRSRDRIAQISRDSAYDFRMRNRSIIIQVTKGPWAVYSRVHNWLLFATETVRNGTVQITMTHFCNAPPNVPSFPLSFEYFNIFRV